LPVRLSVIVNVSRRDVEGASAVLDCVVGRAESMKNTSKKDAMGQAASTTHSTPKGQPVEIVPKYR
jgi:hypothetical protein